ncbi:hypothetical protein SAMN02910441_02321 [Ruminococcus sp. YE282]|nr:hypothetical protein SAMN02910441_02321 [Ruminococcus bromii]
MLLKKKSEKLLFEHYLISHCIVVSYILTKCNKDKLYLPCLEVPITTHCTLCCEKCSNLIQYYKSPYHVDYEKLILNISKLCECVDGIDCLRILGGEPLLAPNLSEILLAVSCMNKIKNIVIVTNGTLVFTDQCVGILKNNKKIKISISNYKKKSIRLDELIAQLEENGIHYVINDVLWKDKANISFKHKNSKKLKKAYNKCPNRFFSLLNDELHMCPHSAHGADLNVFEKLSTDYVCIAQYEEDYYKLKLSIKKLLDNSFITACNYCDEDVCNKLPLVETAKQCRKEYALQAFENMRK